MNSTSTSNVKKLTITALLTALAIIIPVYFVGLKIIIGPFTATLGAHVPMFISMFFGPGAAAVVGVGSVIGFLISGMPTVILARASSHIVVGVAGALLIGKKVSFTKVALITGPIHAILEGLLVIPFIGTKGITLVYVVAIGTLIHHLVDAGIAFALVKALSKSGSIKLLGRKKIA